MAIYAIDGVDPFEINLENFDASAATVRAPVTEPVRRSGVTGQVVLRTEGVRTHGATAKVEGYLNPTVACARSARVDRAAVDPSEGGIEMSGPTFRFVLAGAIVGGCD